MATDDPLNDLLDALRADGDVDSQGRFTLDRAQARAKLQKFQLADARRYVLELVQAAVLRGATAIDFHIDADDMRMRFDGPSFTAAELDDLWGSIFADGDGKPLRAVRQLALGLNAALGLGPKQILVRSGAAQLRVRPGEDDEHTAIDPPIDGTTIHVQRKLRLGLVVDFLRNLGGLLGEERHLHAGCRYAAIPITLDGKPIARDMAPTGAVISQPLAADGLSGGLALTASDAPAELRLVKDGVWVDTHALEQCGPGLVAVVAADALRKDVSLAKIVADDALGRIVGLVRAERWSLLARLVQAVERGEQPPARLQRVRAEVLEFLRPRDLQKRPDVAVLARTITWPDARGTDPRTGQRRTVSLAELAERGQDPLRHAAGDYLELPPDDPPVPQLGPEAKRVGRILGVKLEAIDPELQRATARERARRAWLTRAMDPRLPDDRRYLLRTSLTAPGLRGELGVAADALTEPSRSTGSAWLLVRGCLLARLELPWPIPALDLALEGTFTPTEHYDDVVRDAAFARAVLRALAALHRPLAWWAREAHGGPHELAARGLVKVWLSLVLSHHERAALWLRLGVPEAERPTEPAAAELLPQRAALLDGDGPSLADLPLFEDFDGARASLRDLAARRDRVGALDELDHGVARLPDLGREVLWLGGGDRKLLAGLFGADALRSYQPVLEAILRERAFRARPPRDLGDLDRILQAELLSAGLAPQLWRRTFEVDGVAGVLALFPDREPAVTLLLDGRPLATRKLDLGLGPLVGAATSPALRPRASWDDVEDDPGFSRLCDVLRDTQGSIVDGLLRAPAEDLHGRRAWLTLRLLDRLASPESGRLLQRLPDLPHLLTFPTLDRTPLSLEQVGAEIVARRTIEWVPPDAPEARLSGPPILRLEPAELHALRALYGEGALVDGSERLRRAGLAARLESLPAIDRIALDPRAVFFTQPLTGGGSRVTGEIGLDRARREPGLELELCTAGRRITVVSDPDVLVPVAAILGDPELPLTPLGVLDLCSKRYGQHLRRCRRAVPKLLTALCRRWPDLHPADREPARALLLDYATRELKAREDRGESREAAWQAVRALPLFTDLWGQHHSLADIEERCKARGSVDVLRAAAPVDPAWAKLERLILVADPAARPCLAAALKLVDLDDRWADEVVALRRLAEAPEFVLPDLRAVAWIDRKATVAGDLKVRLWLPRTPSDADVVIVTRGRLEVARLPVIRELPCAGHLEGPGLFAGADDVLLDERQRLGLARQVCTLYETLAGQLKNGGGRLDAGERERARAWLVHVDQALEISTSPLLARLGKPLARLRTLLATLAPPSVRKAAAEAKRARARQPAPTPAAPPEPTPAPPTPAPTPAPEPRPTPTPAPTPATPPPAPPTFAPLNTETLRQVRFLNAVRDELAWARERHGAALFDRLGLDRLRLGPGDFPGVAFFDRGVVLRERHPLVARQLTRLAAGEPLDPIDLTFLASAVYAVLNEAAEEIDRADEQAFLARLAEGLALELSGT